MDQTVSRKKILVISGAAFLVGVLFVSLLVFRGVGPKSQKTVSLEFGGLVTRIEGSSIYAMGNYKVGEGFEPTPKPLQVEMLVDENTKFTKTLLYLPSSEELKKTKGWVDYSKLKKEERIVDFGQLKKDIEQRSISVIVTTDTDIYKKAKFKVKTVKYEVAFTPEFDTPSGN